jgi:hypothetical protein
MAKESEARRSSMLKEPDTPLLLIHSSTASENSKLATFIYVLTANQIRERIALVLAQCYAVNHRTFYYIFEIYLKSYRPRNLIISGVTVFFKKEASETFIYDSRRSPSFQPTTVRHTVYFEVLAIMYCMWSPSTSIPASEWARPPTGYLLEVCISASVR